jgi:hypothetical protein
MDTTFQPANRPAPPATPQTAIYIRGNYFDHVTMCDMVKLLPPTLVSQHAGPDQDCQHSLAGMAFAAKRGPVKQKQAADYKHQADHDPGTLEAIGNVLPTLAREKV